MAEPVRAGAAQPALPGLPAPVLNALLEAGQIALLAVERGRIAAANAAAGVLLGVPPAQGVGIALESLAPPGAAHPWRQLQWLAGLPADRAECFECALQRADGRVLRVGGHAWRETLPDSAEGRAWLALIDLEQRREAERRTAQAQASLQRVIETAPLAIAVFEMPGRRVLQANQAAELFFGLPMAALLGRAPSQWPAGTVGHEIAALEASLDLATESPPGVRREIVVADGEEGSSRVWDTRFVSMTPDAGREFPVEASQVLMIANEVTDQRAAEQERFDAAIAQRGMLVQEVHHRIKNNLQGVAGLLQQASARYPEVAPILSEAVGQLQAIAQVYGLQVGSGGPVQFAGLLQAVAQSVQRTFSRPIEVAVAGEGVERWRLPEAEAIPVALTVNELLTNALKHGGDQPVQCCLRAGAADVTVEIVNQGRLREGFDLRARSSGIRGLGLVRALLPRRSAELSLSQDGDRVVTRVTLRPPAVRRDG